MLRSVTSKKKNRYSIERIILPNKSLLSSPIIMEEVGSPEKLIPSDKRGTTADKRGTTADKRGTTGIMVDGLKMGPWRGGERVRLPSPTLMG